jgi:hypothetical protein
VLLLAALGACGGSVRTSSTNEGNPGGGGGGSASVAVDASMPPPAMTTPATIETVADACQAMCGRLAQVNCMKQTCVADCQKAQLRADCADPYLKFLRCALSVPFLCDNGVADLMGSCAQEKNEFLSCRMGIPATSPDAATPVVEEPPPVPMYPDGGTTACREIPLVPEGAMCSGSNTVVEDAGPDAEERAPEPWPYCSRTCGDGQHKWSAECIGGKCICRYDEKVNCTCPQRLYECNLDCCF